MLGSGGEPSDLMISGWGLSRLQLLLNTPILIMCKTSLGRMYVLFCGEKEEPVGLALLIINRLDLPPKKVLTQFNPHFFATVC